MQRKSYWKLVCLKVEVNEESFGTSFIIVWKKLLPPQRGCPASPNLSRAKKVLGQNMFHSKLFLHKRVACEEQKRFLKKKNMFHLKIFSHKRVALYPVNVREEMEEFPKREN